MVARVLRACFSLPVEDERNIKTDVPQPLISDRPSAGTVAALANFIEACFLLLRPIIQVSARRSVTRAGSATVAFDDDDANTSVYELGRDKKADKEQLRGGNGMCFMHRNPGCGC